MLGSIMLGASVQPFTEEEHAAARAAWSLLRARPEPLLPADVLEHHAQHPCLTVGELAEPIEDGG